MYYPNIVISSTLDLKGIRKKNNWTQSDLAKKLGVHVNTVLAYEKGSPIPDSKMALLNLIVEGGKQESVGNAAIQQRDNFDFVELDYIPVKARATFAEIQQLGHSPYETYRVLRTDIEDTFNKQVIIEIDGDSMEPNYTSGTKVRCKEIDTGDWMYINSGVYAVVYSNFFVVKRVKNSPLNGLLTLHSDNTETGGTTDVPLADVRKIWKVMRIVDAPAR